MSTTEKTLPTFVVNSRFVETHHSLPSSEHTTPVALQHGPQRPIGVPVAGFPDPYEQLPMLATEDRIRAILGLRREASLPKVNAATMLKYYRFLSSRLTLPCEARYSSDADDTVYPVTVVGLVDPQTIPSDNRAGLFCIAHHRNQVDSLPLVNIEVGYGCPNFPILEDYWFWFWNWRESRSYRPSKPR